MITMKDPELAYPNREQMLALIRAQAAVGTEDCADESDERSSPASETPPFPTCIGIVV